MKNRIRWQIWVVGLTAIGGLLMIGMVERSEAESPYLTPSRHRQEVKTIYHKGTPAPYSVGYRQCGHAWHVRPVVYPWLFSNRDIAYSRVWSGGSNIVVVGDKD